MRCAAREAFTSFSAAFEGVVPWMYLDIKGLVTVAIGNLIDPIGLALDRPFLRRLDNEPATVHEIANEWRLIKSHKELAHDGHRAAKQYTALYLTDEGIDATVLGKMAEMEAYLRKRFADWDEWPADAQLATMSMSWACGPAFHFPALDRALRVHDYTTASQECHMDETHNPGLRLRNKANVALYMNAAKVDVRGLDPDVLLWGSEDST